MKTSIKQRCSSISEAIEYTRYRNLMIQKEVADIRMSYGKFKINRLISGWIRHHVSIFCWNDVTEIVMKAFRLSKNQAIELVYNEIQ